MAILNNWLRIIKLCQLMYFGFLKNVDKKVGHGDLLLNISKTNWLRIFNLCLMHLESSENFNLNIGHFDVLMVF